MRLFGYWRSSASYRIRIVLNAKGIPYDYSAVRLDKGEQLQPDHSNRNPMRLVPVLDTGEALLAQSVAIAEYLEALFPTPALLPGDELARAQVREMVNMISSEIQPLGNLRVLNALRQDFGQNDDGVRHWVQTWIGRGFEAFERRAAERSANGQFCFRDSLTLADAWLMPQVYNAERFDVDLAPYPTIQSIVKHCGAIDTVAAAHPSRQPDAPPQQ